MISLDTAERVYYTDPYNFMDADTTPEDIQRTEPEDIIKHLLDIIDDLQEREV